MSTLHYAYMDSQPNFYMDSQPNLECIFLLDFDNILSHMLHAITHNHVTDEYNFMFSSQTFQQKFPFTNRQSTSHKLKY